MRFDSAVQDLAFAVRRLRAAPAFTATAAAVLAVGIAATTTTFTVASSVILRPLPYPDADRLVRVRDLTPEGEPFSLSEPGFLTYQSTARTLAGLAAVKPAELTLTGAGDPARLRAAATSHTLFALLGASPLFGRTFTPEEDADRVSPVVILSHRLWQQRFGADPSLAGRSVVLDDVPHTVVGVMAPAFAFPDVDVWIPLGASAHADATDRWLDAVGRLAADATIDDLRAELRVIAGRRAAEHAALAGWSATATPLADWLIGPAFRRTVWVLFASVGFLLMLACANVANLLMSRVTKRQTEMAIRAALGAGRGRLVRQLFCESVLLAALGGGAGLAAAVWLTDALPLLFPGALAAAGRPLVIDARVLAFTAVVIIGTAAAFGFAPAWYGSRAALGGTLRSGGRAATPPGHRLTSGLVVLQVAIAMLLLVGSGLLTRSFLRLQSLDAGFDSDGVVAVPLDLPGRTYTDARTQAFFRELVPHVAALPGVLAAAATTTNPFVQWGYSNAVTPAERAAGAPRSGLMQAGWRAVTPGYFDTLRIPLVAGRTFTPRDREGSQAVVVISEGLADRLWPGEPAVGQHVYWGELGDDDRPFTVAGVVGDVRDGRLEIEPVPTVYLPHEQVPIGMMTLLLRTALAPEVVAAAVKREIHELDPSLPVAGARSLAANRADAVAAPRVRMLLLVLLGGIALLLAAVGLYAVVAFAVAERTREIAIRLALGATRGRVISDVVGRGARLALGGLAAGLVGAWVLVRFLSTLLFQTDPGDAWVFAAAAIVLGAATILASYLPARRAARVDPALHLSTIE